MKHSITTHLAGIGNIAAALLTLALLPALAACSKDDNHEPPPLNPDGTEMLQPGQVNIDIDNPPHGYQTTLTLTNDGPYTYLLSPGATTYVEAGTYHVSALALPTDESLPTGTTLAPDGVLTLPATPDGELPAQIPALMGGTSTATVSYQQLTTQQLGIYPLTREVTIALQLQGIDADALASCTAVIRGVSHSRSLDTHFATGPADEAPAGTRADTPTQYYVRTAIAPTATGTLSGTFRLLGVDADLPQHLLLNLTYNDAAIPPFGYEADVTEFFSDFNTGPTTVPLGLRLSLTHALGSVSVDVSPWKPGLDDDLTGH